MKTALLILGLWVLSPRASARQADSLMALLTVTTDPPGADLIIDSLVVGRTPTEALLLARGRHVLAISYPSAAEWNGITVEDTLDMDANEHVTKHYVLGVFVRVETVPPGAVVVRGDSALGLTPYTVRVPRSPNAQISIHAEGFRDTVLVLRTTTHHVRVVLQEAQGGTSGADEGARPVALNESSKAVWAQYAAAASTIGFGIATAYLKQEASRNFDLYVSTGDPKYQDMTRKYDKAAIWTLVITELSFALLAYLLLAE